jgi:hypothetical protein
MRATTTRWYPVLLLRDALGRFISLWRPRPPKPSRRRRRPPLWVAFTVVRLVLF